MQLINIFVFSFCIVSEDFKYSTGTEHNCERRSSSKPVFFFFEKFDIQAVKKHKIHGAENIYIFLSERNLSAVHCKMQCQMQNLCEQCNHSQQLNMSAKHRFT